MQTIQQSLTSLSSYPVQQRVLNRVAVARALVLGDVADATVLATNNYQLAEADILMFLSKAPNVSEGGVHFAFSESDKAGFRSEAAYLYQLYEVTAREPRFGYQGEDL